VVSTFADIWPFHPVVFIGIFIEINSNLTILHFCNHYIPYFQNQTKNE
jgi:hypothetical protein